ncbi:MAG: hypothetical protein HYS45_02295 [Parcubacteria group bacterium]|nr:hypothetical protein [Parcubacteria group bacterium]
MLSQTSHGDLLEAAKKAREKGTSNEMVERVFRELGATASPSKKLNLKQQKSFLDKAVEKLGEAGGSFKGYHRGAYGQRQTILKRAHSIADAPGMKKSEIKKQTTAAKRLDISELSSAKKAPISAFSHENASISANSAQSAVVSLSALGNALDSPQVSFNPKK